MRFVAIMGDAGSGKTTLMTAILYKHAQAGTKIISNYNLHGINHTLMPFKQLATLPAELNESAVGMDELGTGADSYDFFSAQSRALTKLVTQSRKRHCVVYFTVQRYGLIAKRLRQQVNGFILMEDIDMSTPHCICAGPCKCGRKGYRCARQFDCIFLDSRRKVVNRETFDGTKWGEFFDTDEIIF
jgi:ABC-type dipeptide/oligopeptide/nickel transport system ATPase component